MLGLSDSAIYTSIIWARSQDSVSLNIVRKFIQYNFHSLPWFYAVRETQEPKRSNLISATVAGKSGACLNYVILLAALIMKHTEYVIRTIDKYRDSCTRTT